MAPKRSRTQSRTTSTKRGRTSEDILAIVSSGDRDAVVEQTVVRDVENASGREPDIPNFENPENAEHDTTDESSSDSVEEGRGGDSTGSSSDTSEASSDDEEGGSDAESSSEEQPYQLPPKRRRTIEDTDEDYVVPEESEEEDVLLIELAKGTKKFPKPSKTSRDSYKPAVVPFGEAATQSSPKKKRVAKPPLHPKTRRRPSNKLILKVTSPEKAQVAPSEDDPADL